jgi:hypothetical protein
MTTTGWLLVAIIVLLVPIAIAALLYVMAVWHEARSVHHPTYNEIAHIEFAQDRRWDELAEKISREVTEMLRRRLFPQSWEQDRF